MIRHIKAAIDRHGAVQFQTGGRLLAVQQLVVEQVESAARIGQMTEKTNGGRKIQLAQDSPGTAHKTYTQPQKQIKNILRYRLVHVLCLVVAAIQFGQCAAFDQPTLVRYQFDATAAGGDQMQTTHRRTTHDKTVESKAETRTSQCVSANGGMNICQRAGD